MDKIYKLINLSTGEELFFPCQYAISRHFGKSKAWANYIIKTKNGNYKDFKIVEVKVNESN